MTRTRRFITDATIAVASLSTVFAAVSFISPDLRAQIAGAVGGDTTGQLTAIASRALDVAHTFTRLPGNYFLDSTPLVGFGILAVVLTAMMVRT